MTFDLKHTILIAPMFCIFLFFSCTYVERDNCWDSGGKNYNGCRSSSVVPSGCKNAGKSYSCSMKGYRTVKIGEQVWMAENLNCDVEGSYCENDGLGTEYCDRYGRMYDWCTAMAVCPIGWHLPSDAEWQELVDFAGGNYVAGKYLKAKEGWGDEGNGEDKFGFSASLPGIWWTSTDLGFVTSAACFRSMNINTDYVSGGAGVGYDKKKLLSVRCIKD